MRTSEDSGDLVNDEGVVMPCAEAQEKIRQTIATTGKFILGAYYLPEIGEVQSYAGLPLRVVRWVSRQEAEANALPEIWGSVPEPWSGMEYFFEVEVAD